MLHLLLRRENVKSLILLIMLLTGSVLKGQALPDKQHMIGVRGGYAFNGVHFNPNRKQSTVPSYINASLLYTYYHDLWGTMPYFGFQTGLTYTQQGYETPDLKRIYEVVRVPLTSQFHIDFWKMRILINLGCFGSYRMSAVDFTTEQPEGIDVEFDCNHIYLDYGIQAGAGLALALHPFEFHIEANYLYSLSMIENPALYSNEFYTYGYPNQLLFTLGVFIHL